jgi:hypothetical protein
MVGGSMMAKHFRDLTEEEKASHSVTEEPRDESFVYCTNCGRAMEQGDCLIDDDLEFKLGCAYSDCVLEANIAYQSLHGWDAYRRNYRDETADWPDTPTPGECYTPEGGTPRSTPPLR